MAFSEWQAYFSGSTPPQFLTNVITPLVGAGSGRLSLQNSSPNSPAANIVVTDASGKTKGVTKGRLRSLFRYDSLPYNGIFGMTFCQSVENVTTTGTFYSAALLKSDGKFHVYKHTSGGITNLQLGGATAFIEPSTREFMPGNNVIFAMEVEWLVDMVELGGVAIFVRYGFATDFSDLTNAIAFTHSATPIVTSVAEGIFFCSYAGGGVTWNLDFDQTTLFIP